MELREPPKKPETNATLLRTVVLLQGLGLLGLVIVALLVWQPPHRGTHPETNRDRELASKLKAAGALDEAAVLYESYLGDADESREARAHVAYSLGNTYLELGQYEKALRWYYTAEALGADDLKQTLGERIVMVLERMGRTQAARAALNERTQVAPDTPQRAASDKVLAKLGEHAIYASDLQQRLDDLPPELKERFAGADKREEFLKKTLADELIWQKAQKLGYDKDPVVRRRLEALYKELVVGAFVERELVDKIELHDTDLKAYFEANRARFETPTEKGSKPRTFDQAKQQVANEYRMQRIQDAYRELITRELSSAPITLYPENLKSTP